MGTITIIGGKTEKNLTIENNTYENNTKDDINIVNPNVGGSFSITDRQIYIDGKPAHFVDKKTGQPIDLGTSYTLKDLNDPNKPTMLKIGNKWIEVEYKTEAKTSEDVQGAPNRNDAQKQAAKAIEKARKQAADAQREAAKAFEEALREGENALNEACVHIPISTTYDPPLTKQVYFTGYKTASEATNNSILSRIVQAISSLVRGENGKSDREE